MPVTFKPDDPLNVPAATDDQAPAVLVRVRSVHGAGGRVGRDGPGHVRPRRPLPR